MSNEDEVPVTEADPVVLSRARKVRGGHRANLKKIYKDVDACLKGFEIRRMAQLLALRGTLERKGEVIAKLDEEILEEVEDEEKISEEIEACEGVQLQIRTFVLDIDIILKKVDEATKEEKPVMTSQRGQAMSMMKLPKLEIAKFGGNPREFRGFRDAFQVAIDDNKNLSNIEKFTYLRSYLTGEAEGSIKGLAATEANYKEALEVLEQRYGNKQVIVNSHMDSLIKLPQVIGVSNTKSLRKLHDEIETNLRSLKSLGVTTASFGCLLVPILLSKLPRTLNLHLSRKFDSNKDVWEVDKIMEELKKELEARERCHIETEEKNDAKFQKRSQSTTEALVAEEQKVTCAYCDGKHYSDQCRVVTDIGKRKELLWKKRRCYQCTRANHVIKDCTMRKCFKCNGSHHTSICENEGIRREEKVSRDREEKKDHKETQVAAAFSSTDRILLQTANLTISSTSKSGGMKSIVCKVIFDSGSQRSYITTKAAKTVGACIHHKEKLVIGGFGGTTTKEKLHDVVEVSISKKNLEPKVTIQGIVVERICSPLRGKYIAECINSFPHLVGLPLADEDVDGGPQEVHVLIGLDHYHDVITGESIRGAEGPVAMASKFGYILSGMMKSMPGRPSNALLTQVLRIEGVSNEEIYSEVKKFWEMESLGIKDESNEKIFDVKVEKRPDRYYVNLPWKKDHAVLCDNFQTSRKRLFCNLSRMRKNPKLLLSYSEIMKSQEEAGVIEEVKEIKESMVGKTYYMPHHAVVREEKMTTKIRVVYDASSKCYGASLNECLQGGSTTFTDLLPVLLRFRLYRIAVIADIQQAFLSVGIKEEDRDALRFLWVENVWCDQPRVRHMRFTRVCFGIISSMAHLDTTIRHHLQLFEAKYTDTVRRIDNSLYVDDLTSGHDSSEKAWKLYKETKYIFGEAAMNIRKWKTNDKILFQKIEECEELQREESEESNGTYAAEALNPEESAPTKVLGIPWDVDQDVLSVTLETLKKYHPGRITKRVLLRAVASVFDPLGFLSPLIVTLKILFQDVCKNSKDWDEVLDAVHQQRWDSFLHDVQDFKGLQIPRCYCSAPISSAVLVGLGDASEVAYAACIYVVCQNSKGDVSSSLVVSKSRVAPLKKQSIPRLELLASLILSRLMQATREEVQKVLKIERVVCLTDAEVVLSWIQGEDKEYKQFVQNRVVEIRRNTAIESWHHVPGAENVADLPSRGCSPKALDDVEVREKWMQGPRWLRRASDEWPIRNNVKHKFEDLELRKKESERLRKTACLMNSENLKPSLQEVIPYKNYSTMSRLVRITGWCKRFLDNCRFKYEERKRGELNSEEYQQAEGLWIKSIQNEMKSDSGYQKRSQSLGVYEDEQGYLRCKGRIGKAKIPFTTRFPMLLPTYHYITELIVEDAHEKVYHNGVKETLAELRSRYWLVKGRQKVKRIIKECHLCRILEGLAYPAPVTCDLPDFRVDAGKAFKTAGVDFCGPVYIKQMYKNGDGVMNKAYIAITTCASSRMLHLELTPDLTTSAYLRSQRRFTARRGFPSMMVSDNGKTFKGSELARYNAKHGIKWRFNLPKAPWWGGMYERMVRSVKRCLKKAVGHRNLTYEELLTILIEVEAVINNRPLTYIDEDDLDRILTPSHLFCGRRTLDSPKDDGSTFLDLDCKEGVRRMRLVNSIIEHFWKRWSREYLVELRENAKMRTKQKKSKIEVGDIVLIHEDGVKRDKWRLGKIEEVITGNDNVVRGAVLKTCRDGKPFHIKRPLQKLYPLEVGSHCIAPEVDPANDARMGPVNGAEVYPVDDANEESDVINSRDGGGDLDKSTQANNSGSRGSSGGTPGGVTGQTLDKIDKLLANKTKLRSTRTAAIDGQLRRQINDMENE